MQECILCGVLIIGQFLNYLFTGLGMQGQYSEHECERLIRRLPGHESTLWAVEYVVTLGVLR